MKIAFTAVPRFQLELTRDQIRVLLKVSKHHYDMTCVSYSRTCGLFYIWNNHAANDPDAVGINCFATLNELDIASKCLENVGCLTEPDKLVAREISQWFRDALLMSNRTLGNQLWIV